MKFGFILLIFKVMILKKNRKFKHRSTAATQHRSTAAPQHRSTAP